jgi:hypothetical protein
LERKPDRIAKTTLLCRRTVLQIAASCAGTAAILAASPKSANAAPKISKKAVAYQDHPDGDKQCDKCAQFQAPDACKMVEGPISPQGSCRIFMPFRQT